MGERERYQLRKAAGMYWLLDMGQSGEKDSGVVSFNESGAFIWEQFMRLRSEEAAAEEISRHYDVSYEECLQDVRQFLAQIRSQGIDI